MSSLVHNFAETIRRKAERTHRVLRNGAAAGMLAMQKVVDLGHSAAGNHTYNEIKIDLEDMIYTVRYDVVTNVIDRKRFPAELAKYAEHTKQTKFVGAFVDVVGLGEVNNAYNHAMGDNLLSVAGWGLKQLFHLPVQDEYPDQPTALVGRWGGDEFVALMPAEVSFFDHLGESVVFDTIHEVEESQKFGKSKTKHAAVWNLREYYEKYMNNEQNRHISVEVKDSITALLIAGIDEIRFAYNLGAIEVEDDANAVIKDFMGQNSSKYVRKTEKVTVF